MNIFPFTDPQEFTPDNTDEELPMAREWAWDFQAMDFKKRNGKMYLVEGKEALKIWLWKIFQTPRYRYLIYSWDYGHELEDLIGEGSRPFIESEAARMVEEAIMATLDEYVERVASVNVSMENDLLNIEAAVETVYGEVEFGVRR